MILPDKITCLEGSAMAEISSNYGTWEEAIEKYQEDRTLPIIMLETVYVDGGDEYPSIQGLSMKQAEFIVDRLGETIKYIKNAGKIKINEDYEEDWLHF